MWWLLIADCWRWQVVVVGRLLMCSCWQAATGRLLKRSNGWLLLAVNKSVLITVVVVGSLLQMLLVVEQV